MSEMDENQRERLFDALLTDADRWNTAPLAQARRAAETDETVAEDLAFVAALRAVTPSRPETAAACERIAQRLAQLMREEPGHATAARLRGPRAWLRAVTAPPARATPRIAITAPPARVGRVATFAGAAFILILTLLIGATATATQALPESPLYGLKRAEETLQLDLAMTDDSRGAALEMIAGHRLAEATAEADQQHPEEARALLRQFDATLDQLITLTAHAQATHEADAASLARAVRATLTSEEQSAAHANAQGQASFAAAIVASAQAAQTRVQQAGVALPTPASQSGASQTPGVGGSSSTGSGAGNSSDGKGNNSGKGSPQGTPGPKPTHTPHPGKGEDTTPTTTTTPTVSPTATTTP